MNKAIIIGRLTRDPELKASSGGHAVCSFTLAVNRQYKNDQGEREADFVSCVAWRANAENVAKYLQKGSQCAVIGRIQTRNHDDKNGVKRYVTEIVVDEVQFLGNGKAKQEQQVYMPAQEPSWPGKQQPGVGDGGYTAGFSVVDDDELPF